MPSHRPAEMHLAAQIHLDLIGLQVERLDGPLLCTELPFTLPSVQLTFS